ncbi:MAG: helix-turn-helix domain-containing protein [Methanophagales archaeon]|nr:helix-turn-helix domain-containing protein [Methanophagales archaeon]
MKAPCEIIIWYILPSIRSELVKKLIECGMSQKEVSERLVITEATVSQYVNKKRGSKIEFKQDTTSAIETLAEDVIKGDNNVNLTYRICEICMMLKKDKTVCELHKDHDLVPAACEACFEL